MAVLFIGKVSERLEGKARLSLKAFGVKSGAPLLSETPLFMKISEPEPQAEVHFEIPFNYIIKCPVAYCVSAPVASQ